MHLPAATAALLLAIPLAFAQTFTECDPTKKTCPADTGLPTASYSADFSQGAAANASWSVATGTTIQYGSNGAVFSIANAQQAPTMETDFYVFFGRIDVVFRAATGKGIVSSIVLESDDLDEIDWEFIGGVPNQVQSNYYGKGNTTTYDRVEYHTVADTQNTWHTYSVDWTAERIQFIIDGTLVRTLQYGDAVGGQNFPQTPMQLKLGSWPAGASKNEGTATWAGGAPDFSQGPFDMYVKSVTIQNYNPACSYTYGDMSGSWESINVVKTGDSCNAQGSSSSQSATVSPTASGSAASSVPQTATDAPTSSHSVDPIVNTNHASSTTAQGPTTHSTTASPYTCIAGTCSSSSLSPSSMSTAISSHPLSSVNSTTAGSGHSAPSASAIYPTSSIEPSPGLANANTVTAAGSLLTVVAVALFLL